MAEIAGVQVVPLTPHHDERGTFIELFRLEWGIAGAAPVQWNAVTSRAGVLRGVHVHHRHHDFLTVLSGTLVLGLHDLRPEPPSARVTQWITMTADQPVGVAIPPGVCHGFWFPEATVHVYAVSHYWNLDDELGCRFDDPALGLDWPERAPLLSPRDRNPGDYASMRAAYCSGVPA